MTGQSFNRSSLVIEDVDTFFLTGVVVATEGTKVIIKTGSGDNANSVDLGGTLRNSPVGSRIYVRGRIYSGSLIASEIRLFEPLKGDER